ncbi:hypothetical protein HNY73_017404 [Argiope bruennichi]|uniref:Uncharacterized protein n=1 Tax=Argiope bruennichi TaxID=94029 RepID=A0A8T0ECJ2_ARGBR|nr:hypothetical protein HNY73_017404 [Argiope bruennichi]
MELCDTCIFTFIFYVTECVAILHHAKLKSSASFSLALKKRLLDHLIIPQWAIRVAYGHIPMPFQTLLFEFQTRMLSKADTCISKKPLQDGIEMISVGKHRT